jgi:4-amino-4-deoxy-L-arabinose transferase-like glycosyltransferase
MTSAGFLCKPKWLGLALVASLVLLKAILVFAVVPAFVGSGTDYQGAKFPDNYDLIAENLLAGHGYRVYPETSPTLLRTPGYVLVLAAVFAIFGKSLLAVQAVNFLLSLATAWIVFLLVRRIGQSERWALLAAVVSLLHPGMIMAETRGGLESLLSLVLVAFVYLTYLAVAEGRLRHYLMAGAVFGFCLLVKSSAAVMLPAMAGVALLTAPSRAEAIRRLSGLFAAGLVGLLVMSPWVLRNYVVTGKPIPTMTVGGLAAFQGLYVVQHPAAGREHHEIISAAAQEQDVIARERGRPYRPEFFPQFFDVQDEIDYYAELGRRAREAMIESPALAGRLVLHNSWAFWIQGRTARATLLNAILTLPFLLLVVIGAWLALRADRAVGLLLAGIIAFVIPHLTIIALARYHIPLIPLLAVLASYPLYLTLDWLVQRRSAAQSAEERSRNLV